MNTGRMPKTGKIINVENILELFFLVVLLKKINYDKNNIKGKRSFGIYFFSLLQGKEIWRGNQN